MAIDICITTYRGIEKLKVCLASVLERTKYVDFNIYLWCNDPNDEVKKAIYNTTHIDGIQFTDRVIPVFNDNNNGSFSSNNNAIAAKGTGEYILFLNDDCEPLNDTWLLNMSNILTTDPKVGIVGALLFYPDKKTIQHCGVFFSQRTNNLPFHMFHRQPIDKVSNFVSYPRYYQAVTAACLLIRRSDFELVGGFCSDFYYCFEDTGLCLDVKDKAKHSVVFCPSAQLIHHEGIGKDGKNNPKLQQNVAAFKQNYTGKYFNDYEFYMQDPKFMIYKIK